MTYAFSPESRKPRQTALRSALTAGLLMLSAMLILAPPVIGYVLMGGVGLVAGSVVGLALMSKRAWGLLLAPFGAASLTSDVIGECAVCAPGESTGALSSVIRKAEAEAFLKYGIDTRSSGR
jgi:hypothetical protein